MEGYEGPHLDESKFKKLVSGWVGKAKRMKKSTGLGEVTPADEVEAMSCCTNCY